MLSHFSLAFPGRIFRKRWGKPVGEKEKTFIEHLLFKTFNMDDQLNSHWWQVVGYHCVRGEEMRLREVT